MARIVTIFVPGQSAPGQTPIPDVDILLHRDIFLSKAKLILRLILNPIVKALFLTDILNADYNASNGPLYDDDFSSSSKSTNVSKRPRFPARFSK